MPSHLMLIRITAWLATVLYFAAVFLRVRYPETKWLQRWSRLAWTIGCAIFLAHVTAAFHWVHAWSHSAAAAATARESAAVVGFAWDGGIYFNYVFAALWAIDVVGSWIPRSNHALGWRQARWIARVFLAFIVFNATLVFGSTASRWIGAAGFAALGWAWQARYFAFACAAPKSATSLRR